MVPACFSFDNVDGCVVHSLVGSAGRSPPGLLQVSGTLHVDPQSPSPVSRCSIFAFTKTNYNPNGCDCEDKADSGAEISHVNIRGQRLNPTFSGPYPVNT